MDFLSGLPDWGIALAIFFLRICDVSIGTCRTIAVVQGRVRTSVALGFLEVLIWVSAVSEVLGRASGSPLLLVAYAAGFSTGNAVGIALERWLALGTVIVRIVSARAGGELAETLRRRAPRVFTFEGSDGENAVTLVYVVARRRNAARLVRQAKEIDPELFYAVDPLRESNVDFAAPGRAPADWASLVKKK